MTTHATIRLLLAAGLVTAGLSACKGSPNIARLRTGAGVAVAGDPAAAPVLPTPPDPPGGGGAEVQPAPHAGLVGAAMLPGGAFAGADVQVYRPGVAQPIGTAKTDAEGAFVVDLGDAVPRGALLKVVARKGGEALATVTAAGLLGADGGSLIGADGGSLSGADGGSLIGADGGSLVGNGGNTYTLRATGNAGEARLTVASTLAVAALGKRLEGACRAAYKDDDAMVEAAASQVLQAFDAFASAAGETLAATKAKDFVDDVLGLMGEDGTATMPTSLASALTRLDRELEDAFEAAAEDLGEAMTSGVAAGGEVPEDATAKTSFGGATSGAVDLPDTETSRSGGSGGSSSSRSKPKTSNGQVTITGNFLPPPQRP